MAISSGRNKEANEAKKDLRQQTTSTDSYEDWLKDAGVVDRTTQINIMKDLFGTMDLATSKPILEMTIMEKLQAQLDNRFLNNQFKAIGRDRDRPHTFEKIDETFDPKFINRMINGVETKVRQFDSPKGLENIVVKPNAVRNITEGLLAQPSAKDGTMMNMYDGADWKYGGNPIYNKLSTQEKILVLQRDKTFMKDTTTWQEEYNRQLLIAATETENKMETDPTKLRDYFGTMGDFSNAMGANFKSTYLPSSILDGMPIGKTLSPELIEAYKKLGIEYPQGVGVQKLLMAMGRQNETKFMNDRQKERFKNITYGTVMTKDSGFDEFGMYIEGADGERYNLPQGQTVTTQVFNHLTGEYEDREIPLQAFKAQEEAARKRQLAFGDTRGVLGTGGISFQQELLAAGVGGAANLAISQGQSYYRNVVYGEATGSMARSHAAAQALGRATWVKERAKDSAFQTGNENIRYWVERTAGTQLSAEDVAAINSLQSSHNEQVKVEADKAFDTGKKVNLVWLRIQAQNNAKALGQSISNRIATERATALQFGNQLGISQNEALAILRDKSQGEQTLNDMLAYQMRLDAMSSGVV